MEITYNILLGIACIVAVTLIFIIFLTGKGDAMSGGGGGVRTSFKGRATFDDQMFKYTLFLAGGFVGLMIILDIMSAKLHN